MRVAINAQGLTDPALRGRGAGRVLSALLHERLPRMAREEVVLFANHAGLDAALPATGRRHATPWPTGGALGRLAWETLILPNALRRLRVEVLLTPSLLPLRTPCPRVVLCSDLPSLFAAPGPPRPRVSASWHRWLASRSLGAADRVVTVSTRTAQCLQRTLGAPADRMYVVPMGGPERDLTARAAQRIPDDLIPPCYLLWSGTDRTRVGLNVVLEAFGRVADLIPHQLLLIGDAGQDVRGTRAAIARAGLAPRVLPLGALPEVWYPAIIRRATALIYPMADNEFARPVLDAFACGTTVLAGNTGALPERCDDAALLFDPASADQLAGLMLDVVRESALRARMVERGLARAADFSWDTAAATLHRLMIQVVEARRLAALTVARPTRRTEDLRRATGESPARDGARRA